jgi:hypothetical protein
LFGWEYEIMVGAGNYVYPSPLMLPVMSGGFYARFLCVTKGVIVAENEICALCRGNLLLSFFIDNQLLSC